MMRQSYYMYIYLSLSISHCHFCVLKLCYAKMLSFQTCKSPLSERALAGNSPKSCRTFRILVALCLLRLQSNANESKLSKFPVRQKRPSLFWGCNGESRHCRMHEITAISGCREFRLIMRERKFSPRFSDRAFPEPPTRHRCLRLLVMDARPQMLVFPSTGDESR